MHDAVTSPTRQSRGLDLLNFFVADVQTGFGPFVAVYLTTQKWTQVEIGFALSLGTITTLIGQVPAGALVDALSNKRAVATAGLLGVLIAALLLAVWPTTLPVILAQMLHGTASCVLTPAIAAISLNLVGHAAFGERLGRNARFAAIGNGLAAGVMGVTGSYLPGASVFWLTAALCVPALLTLPVMGHRTHRRPREASHSRMDWPGLRRLFTDPRLVVFATCVVLFHLSNAAMLPLVAGEVTVMAARFDNMFIAACIIVPQIGVALLSPWVGRTAALRGRRSMLLLGWAALPLRGLLLAVLPGPYLLVAAQFAGGISAAVFGVMLPLIAADLTRGTKHFNLCIGVLGVAISIGASFSTTLGGSIADTAGPGAAFIGLAIAGLAGTLLIWQAMPETAAADELG